MGKNLQDMKKRAAERAVELVQDRQIVGIGTGSTTWFAIQALGAKVADGLQIRGVATSEQSARLTREVGIPLVDLNEVEGVDIVLDGADEIDAAFNMIKGGGGALTREKLVAVAARQRVIMVDESKLVDCLGRGFRLPVEVLPFAWRMNQRMLNELGCPGHLRMAGESPLETDNENYILDCEIAAVVERVGVEEVEKRIKLLPGVIECGLFLNLADTLVIGFQERVEVRSRAALK